MTCSIEATLRRVSPGSIRGLDGRLPALAAVVLLLSACGGISRTDPPARVEERSPSPPPIESQRGSDTQIAAYTPPAAPRYVRPQPKRAVVSLMQRSHDQQRSGDLDGAAVTLERALRIAPDDAVLWQRLAEVRADQQRPDLVVQMAAKSNALSDPADRSLRARNWELIADARRALGDTRGARDASQRAADLR